ncbi:MAG: lytic transglycosylase domain-containing protein [Geminicoccaceae bacterium]
MTGLSRRSLLALPLVLSSGQLWAATSTAYRRFLDEVRAEAVAGGIRAETVDLAFRELNAPNDRIIELDRRQPEGRLTFRQYRRNVVSDARIAGGRERLERHGAVLRDIEVRFGIPAPLIVSLWGIESSFGQYKGRFFVIDSLASLAFDGRRRELFRGQLIDALTILDRGVIPPENMYGSWAGAMGQTQFMPTTYLNHAYDLDGDGRADIWTSLPDSFASMANFLSVLGWDKEYIWGREVSLPGGPLPVGLDTTLRLAEWQKKGVRRTNGADLPQVDIGASLIMPDQPEGPAFLVYDNFRVLLDWNRSSYFALSVGLLADALKAT